MPGDRAAARDAWERAIALEFFENEIDVYDALVALLKHEPKFIAGLDRVKRRVAPMRDRVEFRVIDEWICARCSTTAVR